MEYNFYIEGDQLIYSRARTSMTNTRNLRRNWYLVEPLLPPTTMPAPAFWTWAPHDGLSSNIRKAHWSATDNIPTTPSLPYLFRQLNNIHLDISSIISSECNDDLSSSPHSTTVNTISSALGSLTLDGTTSLSAVNGLTVNGGYCVVVLNHIGAAVMGDGYLTPIHHSNVGGRIAPTIVRTHYPAYICHYFG